MKRSQILKMTFWVVFLLFVTSCATKSAMVQTPKPDDSGTDGQGFCYPKDIIY